MRHAGFVVVMALVAVALGCASIIGVGDDVVVVPSDASDEGETGTD